MTNSVPGKSPRVVPASLCQRPSRSGPRPHLRRRSAAGECRRRSFACLGTLASSVDLAIARAVEHSHMLPEWHLIGDAFAMRMWPSPCLGEASLAINGFSRRFSTGPTNMWMSRPADGLPQDLFLTWEAPQTIDTVDLVFDNLCRLRHENPWENATCAWRLTLCVGLRAFC